MSPSIAIDNTTPEVAIDHTTPAVSESAQPSVVGRTNDLFSLGNRTIVITGGGRGLGIVLAGAVVEAGGDVVCFDLLPEPSAEEWASVQKLAAARGLKATYIKCDITDEQSTEQVLKQVAADAMSRGMPLRGAVTCAGIQQMVPALEYPVDMWKKMLDVNVIGTFIPAKHCARIFKEQNIPGSIVMIASMSGQIANRGLTCTAYNSSKAAVHQMCRSVAQEWGQYGIRVNTLSAGVCIMITGIIHANLTMQPVHPHGNDRCPASREARSRGDLDAWCATRPSWCPRRLQGTDSIYAC
ncbi:hypothetical protein ABZX51_010864 [Aspergillus tubingensis]